MLRSSCTHALGGRAPAPARPPLPRARVRLARGLPGARRAATAAAPPAIPPRPPARSPVRAGAGGCGCEGDHSHDHSHGHSHGHGHGHGHAHHPPSPLERHFDALASALGLASLSSALDHNPRALAASAAALAVAAAAGTDAARSAAASLSVGQPALGALAAAAAAASLLAAGLPDFLDLVRTALAALPRALGGAGLAAAAARLDTHALMAAAALAAACSGAPLEGGLLMVLFGGAHALEASLTRVAAGDLRALLASAPPTAVLVPMGGGGDGGDGPAPDLAAAATVPASAVRPGDTMLVRPGEAAAVDGVVIWGRALVSAEHITGEALPRSAGPGCALPAGAVAHDGALVLRATAPAAASAPARIAALAASAQATKPRLTAWLDGFGAAYARAVAAGTAAAFVCLLLAGVPLSSTPGLAGPAGRGAASRAMALLTAASPCALAVAPLAYVSAIAAASRRGALLLRGGAVLDALLRVRTVALDKTGTLTTGRLACAGAVDVGRGGGGGGDGALAPPRPPTLALAAALAARSTHPVSAALTAAASGAGVAPAPAATIVDFEAVPGCGVRARLVGGEPAAVLLGSPEWVAGALPPGAAAGAALAATGAALESRALTVSALAIVPDGPAAGPPSVTAFAFADGVRSRAAAAVRALRAGGRATGGSPPLSVLMLTGDNATSASRIARELGGLDGVRSALAPADKVAAIQGARAGSGGGGVLMVGDGVNDAPALAAADVGAALAGAPGEGAAAAAADVLLLGGAGVEVLPPLFRLAAGTRAVLAQNLAIAAASVAALAPAAVLGVLPLWAAVALHEGGTVLVALNSLRPLLMARADRGEEAAARAGGGAPAALPWPAADAAEVRVSGKPAPAQVVAGSAAAAA